MFHMIKRDSRLFMRCLIPAVILTMVFAMVSAAAAFVASKGAQAVFTPVKTAVVDEEDSFVSRLVVSGVGSMDYIAEMMQIVSCDMDEAMDGLEDGTYAAVIVLPEGMVDKILWGQEIRGSIYLSSAAASHSEVVASTAAFGETLLAAGQYGIFCGANLIWDNDLSQQFYEDFLDEYNGRLIGEAVDAGSAYFDVIVTDYADTNMPTTSYYALSWLTLLMMLMGLFLADMYTADLKKPILCRLRGLGVRDGSFLLGKILLPFGFILVIVTGILWAISGFIPLEVDFLGVICAVLASLLAALIVGCIIMVGNNGVPVVVAVATVGLLLCGGMIPRQMLPRLCLIVGGLTPFGAVQNLLTPIFGGKILWYSLAAAAVYAVGLLLLVRRRMMQIRIGGDGA